MERRARSGKVQKSDDSLTRLLSKTATYSRRLIASRPQMHWLRMNWLLLLRQPFEPHYSVGQSYRSVAAPTWWILLSGANANWCYRKLRIDGDLEDKPAPNRLLANLLSPSVHWCKKQNGSNTSLHLSGRRKIFLLQTSRAHTHTQTLCASLCSRTSKQ